MTIDSKLTWKQHIVKKRKQVNIIIKQLNWLLGRKSNLAIENKLLIYETIIILIWTYGMELRGCASKSNISIIQRKQSKILRMIADAPWYVSNAILHAVLGVSYVQDDIHKKCNKHHTTLESHENPLLKSLLVREENPRLKRNWQMHLIRGTGDSPLEDSPSRHCNNHNISL
jgi:hypothetical protein